MRQPSFPIAVAAILVAVGLVTYHGIFGNGFHYDDEHSIVENPHIRSLSNIPRFFWDPSTFSVNPDWRMYRPLLVTTYALNYWLADPESDRGVSREVGPHLVEGEMALSAGGFHAINLILHMCNAWLLWFVCRSLHQRRKAALFSALLFVVHPLMSEPVNYISSRSTLLSALFLLGALLVFIRATDRPESISLKRSHVLISLQFMAAMWSKSIAIAFPVLGCVYLSLAGMLRRKWQLLLGPVVLAGAYVLGTRAIIGKALLEPVRSIHSQWASQLKGIIFYVAKVIMPVNQSVEPQFAAESSLWNGIVVLAGFGLVSVATIAWRLRRRYPLVILACTWALISTLPSSLVPLNVLVNEHRLYLPMAALSIAASSLFVSERRLLLIAASACLATLMILTVQRNVVWTDEERVWSDAVEKGPLMTRPHVNLGKAYLDQERFQEAIEASRRALALSPNLPRAHYNIGTAYLHQLEREKAIASYSAALEINPRLMEAHNNLGNAYKQLGRYDEAITCFQRALSIVDKAAVVHNIGSAFLSATRYDSAAIYFQRAIEMDPISGISYEGLAKAYAKEERFQSEIEVLQQALARWPSQRLFLLLLGDAHAELGNDLEAASAFRRAGNDEGTTALRIGTMAARRHQWVRARRQYEIALESSPSDPRIHIALAELLADTGSPQEALVAYRAAAELDSTADAAFTGIGEIYLKHFSFAQAIAAFERSIDLAPDDPKAWQLLAQAYSGTGKHELAATTLQKAIELAPDEAEQYHNLGMLYQQLQAWPEAERAYREALRRNRGQSQSYFNLGYIYLQQERYEEAIEACRRVLELDPGNGGVYVNMASAWRWLERWSEAESAYEKALELSGDDEEWKEGAIGRLAELRALKARRVEPDLP